MATNNKSITGYIVEDVHVQFIKYCETKEYSTSKALNIILREFFGLTESEITTEEFSILRKQVNDLSNRLNNIESKILTQEANEAIAEVKHHNINNAISECNTSKVLNTSELAKRFKLARSSINNMKKKFRDGKINKQKYLEWTKSKDPEGKEWFFEGSNNFIYS